MKTYRIKTSQACIYALIFTFLFSCTSKFEEYNKDSTGLYTKNLSIDYNILGAPIQQMQLKIYDYNPAWEFQVQQNLNADVFAGYMMSSDPFNGGANNTNYYLMSGWNGFAWNVAYSNIMLPASQVMPIAKQLGSNDYYSWAKILRVAGMHRVSDIYGPITYSKFGVINNDGSVDYDSQQDAYNQFFADLDSAITVLTPLAQSGSKSFTKFDLVYGGDMTKWVRFANTLRLRLAMRISSVDPTLAKTQGEAALANPLGLLQTADDNFIVNIGAVTHPLNVITSWTDIQLGASIESFLVGYNDPRLPKFAAKADNSVVTDHPSSPYKGLRIGSIGASSDQSSYLKFSLLPQFDSKIILMTTAEAYFLKAEAALRSWSGAGDAQTNYEAGIQASFDQYGLTSAAAAYIADATSQPIPYVDPFNSANNVNIGDPNLSTITIQWDNSASMSTKLERIITQKWIALYPEGQEAWSEFRRTTYPKLFPVAVNKSQGAIPNFIRRLGFPTSEYSNNPNGVANAVTLLGGPDNGGTALWWDKN